MKSLKKALSILLVFVFVFSLVGCSGKKKSDTESTDAKTTGAAASTTDAAKPASSGEVTTVKFSYPVLTVVPSEAGTKAVEDSINSYLEKKGEDVRIKLDPIDGVNYVNQMQLALSSGEGVDIFCPLTGLSTAVASNQVLPLNDYLGSELKDTVAVMGDKWLKPSTYGDKVYAIPCYKGVVLEPYFIFRKDITDKLGFDVKTIKSVKDIEPLLKQVKEKYPDMYPLVPTGGQSGGGNTVMVDYAMNGVNGYHVDNFQYGACVEGNDLTVKNYYATDFFKDACDTVYKWNQEGLIMPDSSLTSDLSTDLLGSDKAFSVITGYGYAADGIAAQYKQRCGGKDFYAISLNKTLITSQSMAVNWAIAYSCKNPKAAAKVLNMLYTDEFVLNSVIFGIEGTDYVKNSDGTVSWPEGKDMNTVPYTALLSCGIVGNMFKQYAMQGNTKADDIKYMEDNNNNGTYSPAFGFKMDASKITSQVTAVDNVIKQYQFALLCGEVDPKDGLPKFLSALKDAGVDDIIKETQTQMDAWKASNK